MIFFQRQKSSFPQNFVQYKISLKKDFTANDFLTKQFFVRKKRLSQNFVHQKTFLPKTCFIKKNFSKKNTFHNNAFSPIYFYTLFFFIETKKRKKICFFKFFAKKTCSKRNYNFFLLQLSCVSPQKIFFATTNLTVAKL